MSEEQQLRFKPVIDSVQIAHHYEQFGEWASSEQEPIVYHDRYNIGFLGLESFHPMDTKKYKKILSYLIKNTFITKDQTVAPGIVSREAMLDVHTEEYVTNLETSPIAWAQLAELRSIAILPNFIIQSVLNNSFKAHCAGTILATGLAVARGWAINLGGGMHHASSAWSVGWCPYSDIYLALRQVRRATNGRIKRALYIDLDVHQGNGCARDKYTFGDRHFCILDAYNKDIFPKDHRAKQFIDIDLSFENGTGDNEYLNRLKEGLQKAKQFFKPDIIIYNAGTDLHEADVLGQCKITTEGVAQRDEMVWQYALEQQVPIVMFLSGGYGKQNHEVVSNSLHNLFTKFELLGSNKIST